MKNVLLTFDYELFLGKRSGSVQNCLIRPTEHVLAVLKRNSAKAVFFIDTTYLFKLNELSQRNIICRNDLDKVINQLNTIVQDGHYIFHHLHPHWLDALYDTKTNTWDLSNNKRFTFSDISIKERDAIFEFSFKFLSDIYNSAGSQEVPIGYRAGGLFIEPIENFIPYFQKYNIKYEFSVVPNQFKDNGSLSYDFRGVPKKPYYYRFKKTTDSNKVELIEFPISVLEIKNVNKVLNGIYFRFFKNSKLKIFGDGLSVSNSINQSETTSENKRTKYLKMVLPLSVEMLNPIIEKMCLKLLKENSYIHFLSHPKLLTPQSLISLDCFLKKASEKFDMNFDFKNLDIE